MTVSTVLIALLGGCARDDAPETAPDTVAQDEPAAAAPAASTEPDPCALLTAQDLEAATGIAPGAGEPIANGCYWAAADGTNPRLLALAVLHGSLTREQWLSGGGSEDDFVDGVGDIAVRAGSQLQVFQGGWLVGVTVRGSDRPEAEQDLARAVHARLAA